jgi:hypothetical protein
VKRAWNALHLLMRIHKKGNISTKRLSCATLVRPIIEYWSVCWDTYREEQMQTLNRMQKKAAKFAHFTNESSWEKLSKRRKISCVRALFKAYIGERAWKATGDRLQRSNYLSRVDHERKVRNRRQKTDIGKYPFVIRTTRLWNCRRFRESTM